MVDKTIAERILRLRNSKTWSRPELGRELASAIGKKKPYSGEAVRRWEEGLDQPGRKARAALAKVFGLSEAYIEFGPATASRVTQVQEQQAQPYHLTDEERSLIASYRRADPRWRLSLRLLAALSDPEDQIDAATDVNMVVARVMGKKVKDLRYADDRRVEETFGKAPHVAAREARKER
jgi:transcriptional regulator with XRE-family HTH domain